MNGFERQYSYGFHLLPSKSIGSLVKDSNPTQLSEIISHISAPLRDLEWGASVQMRVFTSRARECSFGNPSRTSQELVSEVFGASATIDDHCTTATERTATLQATECQRIFLFRCQNRREAGGVRLEVERCPVRDQAP